MIWRCVLLGLIAGVWSVAQPAAAATRSFSIAPFSATADTSAFLVTGGIELPSGTPRIYVNFVLPMDYALNSAVTLRLHLSTLNAPCGISFGATYLVRSRPGSVRVEKTSPGPESGLLKGPLSTLLFETASTTVVRSFTLQAPTTGALLSQKAGDGIQLALVRVSTDSGDTCEGQVELSHIEVRYSTP